jgi:hypothetical protein
VKTAKKVFKRVGRFGRMVVLKRTAGLPKRYLVYNTIEHTFLEEFRHKKPALKWAEENQDG